MPLCSNVATASNVIPEPRPGSSSDNFPTGDSGRSLSERSSFAGVINREEVLNTSELISG